MSWARNKVEQLRGRVYKVDNLWNKEKKHCFAKMTQDSNYRKCHAGKVAKRVSNKDLGGVPRINETQRLWQFVPPTRCTNSFECVITSENGQDKTVINFT